MPTAAQWKVSVNRLKQNRHGYGDVPWAGGAWRQKNPSEAPTRGPSGGLLSKDGRAFTPGPGRYTIGAH